ncbi:MAG: aminoacyl-tRNA hydrolase [Chloroflexaceae bacterium]|nr:aminoacyl-tRNA hydrolase [Chloroflexaceae bacterium]
MWIIVGLGNPGAQYARTRHNVGFMALDRLAERHGLRFGVRRANAELVEGHMRGQRVVLAKPQTFMNLSGRSVVALKNWYKIDLAESLLVVYDDLDLPFARLRLRQRGSAGTHNGMRSIVNLTGTTEFARLRIGIDKPPPQWDVANYVLSRWSSAEEAELPALLDHTSEVIETIIEHGVDAAMNQYNR